MGVYWLTVIWRSVVNMLFSFHVPFWCWLTHIRYVFIVTTPFWMCKCINFARDNPCWIRRDFNPTIQKVLFSRHYSIFIIWSKKVKNKLEYHCVESPVICHVKEPLARSRREIWRLSDCNWTRNQNQLVLKRTLNHLAKLAKWLSVRLRTKWFRVLVQLQPLSGR